jgi:hypothetical protein
MDKYELLLALNDLRRTPKEEEKYLRTFAGHLRKAQNANLKWMLKAAAEKLVASTQQLRAKIRGLGGEPGFNWIGEWRDQLE